MIKSYSKGLACMLGEVVGRIVGEDESGSWGEINGQKFFLVPIFSTPHGSLIKTGVMHLSDITEEGQKKLDEYELQLKVEGKEMYAGRL